MARQREDASTIDLVRELVADARTLVRQEAALVRTEIREEFSQLLFVVALLGAAVAVLSVAGLWLLLALTRGLVAMFGWPLWGVYAGVGVVLAAIGVILGLVVWRQIRTIRVLPKTRETVRDHMPWSLDRTTHRPNGERGLHERNV